MLTGTLDTEIHFQEVLCEVNEPEQERKMEFCQSRAYAQSQNEPGQFTLEQICKGF